MNVISQIQVPITCTATGKPRPTLEWFFRDESLNESHTSPNNYTINVDSIRDAGIYTCVSYNKHLRVNKSLELRVQGTAMSQSSTSMLTIYDIFRSTKI